eukprot:GHVS01025092.1.p1 GENE.GHVS01025092.1~~GHVS01025092.1.p1  ORF type:complete len:998 (-),score=136.98 GHVS01025092.1:328-3321(-)
MASSPTSSDFLAARRSRRLSFSCVFSGFPPTSPSPPHLLGAPVLPSILLPVVASPSATRSTHTTGTYSSCTGTSSTDTYNSGTGTSSTDTYSSGNGTTINGTGSSTSTITSITANIPHVAFQAKATHGEAACLSSSSHKINSIGSNGYGSNRSSNNSIKNSSRAIANNSHSSRAIANNSHNSNRSNSSISGSSYPSSPLSPSLSSLESPCRSPRLARSFRLCSAQTLSPVSARYQDVYRARKETVENKEEQQVETGKASKSCNDEELQISHTTADIVQGGTVEGIAAPRIFSKPWIKLVFCIGFLCMASFLLGYDIGVIAGAILHVREYFQLTTHQTEVAVGILNVAATVGVFVGSHVADVLGRRMCVLYSGSVYFIGALLMSCAYSYGVFIWGRIVTGLAIGAGIVIAPLYIAEMSFTQYRGMATALTEIFINVGILSGYVTNVLMESLPERWNWRTMIGVSLLPAAAMICGSSYLFEPPRWLISQQRYEEALEVLLAVGSYGPNKTGARQQAQKEVDRIRAALQSSSSTADYSSPRASAPRGDVFKMCGYEQCCRREEESQDKTPRRAYVGQGNERVAQQLTYVGQGNERVAQQLTYVGQGNEPVAQHTYKSKRRNSDQPCDVPPAVVVNGCAANKRETRRNVEVGRDVCWEEDEEAEERGEMRCGGNEIVKGKVEEKEVHSTMSIVNNKGYYCLSEIRLAFYRIRDICYIFKSSEWIARRYLLAGLFVPFLTQMTGIDAVTYYTNFIFKQSGVQGRNQVLVCTTIMGVFKLCMVGAACVYVERWGRRKLLLLGNVGASISMLLLGASFSVIPLPTICRVACVIAYVCFFSWGLGAMAYTVPSETFPQELRATGIGLSFFLARLAASIVSISFLSANSSFGITGFAFWGFGIAAGLSVGFVYIVVPETKGQSLEEVNEIYKKSRKKRPPPQITTSSVWSNKRRGSPVVIGIPWRGPREGVCVNRYTSTSSNDTTPNVIGSDQCWSSDCESPNTRT